MPKVVESTYKKLALKSNNIVVILQVACIYRKLCMVLDSGMLRRIRFYKKTMKRLSLPRLTIAFQKHKGHNQGGLDRVRPRPPPPCRMQIKLLSFFSWKEVSSEKYWPKSDDFLTGVTLWLCEDPQSSGPGRPSIIINQRGTEVLRGFVGSNSLQDLKEDLQAFGGLQMHGKS